MNNNGWIKLYRKLNDNELSNDIEALGLFTWLLTNVNRKDGTFTTGRLWLGNKFKINPLKAYRLLKRLDKKYNVITLKANNKYTQISVRNWSKYQEGVLDVNNQRTTSEQQVNTKQEYKNKEERGEVVEDTKTVEEIRDFWNGEYGTKYTSVIGFQDNALFWLTQYSLDDIKLAIKNIRRSEYWRNEMTPLIFFRRKSPSKEPVDYIAQFMNIKASPVKKEQPQGVFAQIVQHERERGLL